MIDRAGSIDWLCVPRFDSGACFAALLGSGKHGRWSWSVEQGTLQRSERRYRPDTLVLETDLITDTGRVRLIDFMPAGEDLPQIVRIVQGVQGETRLHMELVIRFDYGWVVPWVRKIDGDLRAVGGPDALTLRTPVETRGEGLTTVAELVVREGERFPFVLSWHPSHLAPPRALDPLAELSRTEQWWRDWASRCTYRGPWRDAVVRSLITLKALIYSPTGAVVAAPTTSLPEQLGSTRNWDYRYSWLRDATFTLYALMLSGYRDEAAAWRDWLLRTIAGSPEQLQTMYGVAGERRLPEMVLEWLPGYAGSAPVRIGNAAVEQLQLDIYGEIMDMLHFARRAGLGPDESAWRVQLKLVEFVERHWQEPDEGLWEVRGPRQHFTHSKVMAWVALDRAIKAVERTGERGSVERWRELRAEIHAQVCASAYDATKSSFTQAYGSKKLDASSLMIPLVGFLPRDDPRVAGTIAAVQRELMQDGLLLRYRSEQTQDGLPPGEGTFLLCTFWLADNLALIGREAEACALFERLLALRNDVGLLAEEYDPIHARMLGNFPQA
ncbi:MAG TPA: glycoside hydrolase family 15 protein, partial [Polyangiales bacterium]|nr:glycoside hydrolase family 15 protein [Polyangiales bacterium]